MAVEDHPVNEKCKIDSNYKAGCWNKPRLRKNYNVSVKLYDEVGSFIGFGTEEIKSVMSVLCRQLGQYERGQWIELPECVGCSEWKKDWAYIRKMRSLQEKEMQKSRL